MPSFAEPIVPAPAEQPSVSQTCTLEPGAAHTVTGVIDGETVTLDDGSSVRLIGSLAPQAVDVGAAAGAWPAEADATRMLSDLVLGKSVQLAYGGRRTDRYGRHLAHLFLSSNEGSTWVQGALLASGVTRAYGLPGNFVCAMELRAHERQAQLERRGLWTMPVYQMKSAADPKSLMFRRGQYEIVEGTIASISRTKSAIYLNFGRDWKSDFTARIDGALIAADPSFDAALSTWEGRHVAVRGWIERRNGPMITLQDLSQIEDLTSPPGDALARSANTERGSKPASAAPPEPNDPNRGTKEKRPGVLKRDPPSAVDL
jgi:micrococcal nuclease